MTPRAHEGTRFIRGRPGAAAGPGGRMSGEYKLCYVDGPAAWFTTAPLDRQWGDDWDDGYRDINAGSPYAWAPWMDCPVYHLKRVYFEGPFLYPDIAFSVQEINSGEHAWLESRDACIWAGARVDEFIAAVRAAGGAVWIQMP